MNQQVSRRTFVRMAGLGSAALALGHKLAAQNQPATLSRKPNLIVFLPDQLRAQSLPCYGAETTHAPSIARLASTSTVFEHAYVTQPICVPSRSSIFTGTWPHVNGCTRNRAILDPKFLCLPEMMADKDYRTGYMGKWHLADEVFPQHGFQEWISTEDGYSKKFTPGRDKKAITDYSKFLFSKGKKPGKKRFFEARYTLSLPIELRKPKFLETHACDFLTRHQKDPFVLFVAFREPHPPYGGPLNDEHPLDQIDMEPSASQEMGPDMPLRARLKAEYNHKNFGNTPEEFRKPKQKYLGAITEIDRSIGAILEHLEKLQLADNTIVVLTADHGDMMGAHRLFGKTFMFEESVSVPYLVHLPGQTRMIRVSQPVSHIDFSPTMLDLLGQPPHQQCVGQTRTELIRGGQAPPENIFSEWTPGRGTKKARKDSALASPEQIQDALQESTRMIVTPDGWKLCLRDKDKNELYYLRDDPGELHNLFSDSSQRERIDKLTAEIRRWQQRTDDKLKI